MRLLSPSVVVALLLVLLSGWAGWQAQGYRLGERHALDLAGRDKLHANALDEIARAAEASKRAEQGKRLALEQQLQSQDTLHHGRLIHAQQEAARLRDRIATADLRLSVLLDASSAGSNCGVPASTTAGSLVHAAPRAELDPAHAKRIISITDAGDEALIALQACQSYIRELITDR
ncbi:lysis system i-spanin subunit Rz [Pseudomonas tohonis]|uniref:lysis system i-spanin subunit Rz n=1 Tax=Pseudomonas tohonis TaxID=2725477 RepID=UPI001F1B7E04|nr:lysis system i-spanin subunit Rz [Pseudomonas tohonis]